MSRKGGPRRTQSLANVDLARLECLIQDVGLNAGFNFGAYNGILKSHAANGLGLLQNKQLLMQIGSITQGTFNLNAMTDLRPLIKAVVDGKDSLNTSKLNNMLFAGQKATNITTMCNHVRRIAKNETRWNQVIGTLVPCQVSSLAELTALVVGDCDSDCAESVVGPKQHTRVLKNEVSLDDDGLPCYLSKVGESSSSSCTTSASSSQLSSGSITDFYIRAMKETDSGFVEEAFKAAASLHTATADPPPVASSNAKSKASSKGERKVAKKQMKGSTKTPLVKASAKAGGKTPVVKGNKEQHDDMADETNTVHYKDDYKNEEYIYKMEKYRKSNSIGIRRKFGDGKQIFSLSSKNLTFEDLEKIALQVIDKLKVQSLKPNFKFRDVELDVKEWAHMQLKV
jgi:hypothetical protein